MMIGTRRVGTAGWAITSAQAAHFAGEGAHLERYARFFNAVEINSSFYRPHRQSTYQRWAASVPADFRFSVKVPKAITHEHRLVDCDDPIGRFMDEVQALGDKLGVLLVQLPPSLAFSERQLPALERLSAHPGASIQCEPRHASWVEPHVAAALDAMGIGRVAADPPPVSGADRPAGKGAQAYFRLHGAPQVYRSRYEHTDLDAWCGAVLAEMAKGRESWVIFDNTVAGFALENAIELQMLLDQAIAGTGGDVPETPPRRSGSRSSDQGEASSRPVDLGV